MKQYRTFTEEDWQATPEPVRIAFEFLEQQVESLTRRLDELENRISRNSGNSNRPHLLTIHSERTENAKPSRNPAAPKKATKGIRRSE